MSAGESNFSKEHVFGNVSVPRNINPRIRANVRRNDPDGISSEPYYPGLNGTTLNIDYSPTGAAALNFTSDSLDDAIDLINASDAANLKAFEEDGYLVLQNLNGGNKNYLEIVSGDAAPILGFITAPEPGSKSFAGELATAPPGRFKEQDNPQGTTAIAGDEDLTSESLNRALAGAFVQTARIARDLDVLVPVVREVSGTVTTHVGSGKKVVYSSDPDLNIPVRGFGFSTTTPPGRELDSVVHIVSTDDEPIIDIDQATERYARVLDIYYEAAGTNSASLDNASSFAAFGTPDGKSIFGPTVPTKNKQAATAINAIRGDLIIANSADFLNKEVRPGDTAVIEGATNNTPFNHNGEFVVTQVLGANIIAVRAKSEFEETFVSSDRPTTLNKNLPGGADYGTVRILVGNYMPLAQGVAFEVPSWVPDATNVTIRCVSGARMRNLGLGDLIRALAPNQGSLLKEFKDHIVDAVAGRRHAAADVDADAVAGSPDSLAAGTVADQLAELLNHVNTAIAGQINYGGGIDWADTAGDTPVGPTSNPSTTVELQLDKILNDLAGAGIDGAAKIRALAAGDLLAGNIRAQLNQLDVEWAKLDRPNTFTDVQSFDTLVRVGETTADTLAALISDVSPAHRKLLWETSGNTNGGDASKVRLYTAGNDGWEITVNAAWDGVSTWVPDQNNSKAFRLRLGNALSGGKVVNVDWFTSTGSAWAEGSWSTLFDIDQTGAESILTGSMTLRRLFNSIGGDAVGSLADVSIPRLFLPVGAGGLGTRDKVCLFEAGNGTDRFLNFYLSDEVSGADFRTFEITWNAKWNATTQEWEKKDNTLNSVRLRINRNDIDVDYQASGTASWANGAWGVMSSLNIGTSTGHITTNSGITTNSNSTFAGSNTFTGSGGARIGSGSKLDLLNRFGEWNGTTSGASSGVANPTTLVTIANGLYAKNMIKAYGRIRTGVGNPLNSDGYNSFIDTVGEGTNTVRIDLLANMANNEYTVLLCPYDLNDGGGSFSSNQTMRAHSLFTTGFKVVGFEIDGTDGGAQIDLTSFGDWGYLAIGRQDS